MSNSYNAEDAGTLRFLNLETLNQWPLIFFALSKLKNVDIVIEECSSTIGLIQEEKDTILEVKTLIPNLDFFNCKLNQYVNGLIKLLCKSGRRNCIELVYIQDDGYFKEEIKYKRKLGSFVPVN